MELGRHLTALIHGLRLVVPGWSLMERLARDLFRAASTLEDEAVSELDSLREHGWQHSLLRVAAWLKRTAKQAEKAESMEVQAKARTVALGKSKAGNAQVAIEFYVMSKGKLEGQTYVWYGSLVPGKATEITTAALRECGWSGRIDELETCSRNPVRIRVEEDERGYMKVKSVMPLKRELFKGDVEFTRAEMDNLQALLDGGPREREPGDDDELPFDP